MLEFRTEYGAVSVRKEDIIAILSGAYRNCAIIVREHGKILLSQSYKTFKKAVDQDE